MARLVEFLFIARSATRTGAVSCGATHPCYTHSEGLLFRRAILTGLAGTLCHFHAGSVSGSLPLLLLHPLCASCLPYLPVAFQPRVRCTAQYPLRCKAL